MPPGRSASGQRRDHARGLHRRPPSELHAAIADGGRLRTLYLIDDLDEIHPSALWADTKLGFDLSVRHHEAWERSAIVTDVEWMARATRLFLWMIPGEARVFPRAELDQAKAWVSGASP